MKRRSPSRVVRSSLNIKFWIDGPPKIADVRPARCPACAKAGHPLGGRVGLVGHGVRIRQLLGPLGPEDGTTERLVHLRRFLCRDCGAVITVAPLEVAPGRLYGAQAIAVALVLFGVDHLPPGSVRDRLRPVAVRGHDRRRWRVLDRWLGAIRAGRLFPRLQGPLPEQALSARGVAGFFARQLGALSRLFHRPLGELASAGAMRAIEA